ncbi:MAG: transposase, partial [Bacillota bacterium]
MNNSIKIKGGNLPESARLFKEVMENPGKMFDILRIDMRERAEAAVNEMIKLELSLFLGRGRYERPEDGKALNYRNGYTGAREYTVKGLGGIKVRVARDRKNEFRSRLIEKYDRYDKALGKDILAMFLAGMSTRNIELFSSQLLGRRVSAGEVSRVNAEVEAAIEAWRTRSLAGHRVKYLMLDGVNFRMRVCGAVEKTPMLVVIGVTESNERIFLA